MDLRTFLSKTPFPPGSSQAGSETGAGCVCVCVGGGGSVHVMGEVEEGGNGIQPSVGPLLFSLPT